MPFFDFKHMLHIATLNHQQQPMPTSFERLFSRGLFSFLCLKTFWLRFSDSLPTFPARLDQLLRRGLTHRALVKWRQLPPWLGNNHRYCSVLHAKTLLLVLWAVMEERCRASKEVRRTRRQLQGHPTKGVLCREKMEQEKHWEIKLLIPTTFCLHGRQSTFPRFSLRY